MIRMNNEFKYNYVLIACLLLSNSLLVSENTFYEAPIIQPGAPGENSKVLDPSVASNIAGAGYVDADVNFLKGMIIHHQQAMFMSRLAKKRTNNKTIIDLANRIDVSQDDEINFMESWLKSRKEIMPKMSHDHDYANGNGRHGNTSATYKS